MEIIIALLACLFVAWVLFAREPERMGTGG